MLHLLERRLHASDSESPKPSGPATPSKPIDQNVSAHPNARPAQQHPRPAIDRATPGTQKKPSSPLPRNTSRKSRQKIVRLKAPLIAAHFPQQQLRLDAEPRFSVAIARFVANRQATSVRFFKLRGQDFLDAVQSHADVRLGNADHLCHFAVTESVEIQQAPARDPPAGKDRTPSYIRSMASRSASSVASPARVRHRRPQHLSGNA